MYPTKTFWIPIHSLTPVVDRYTATAFLSREQMLYWAISFHEYHYFIPSHQNQVTEEILGEIYERMGAHEDEQESMYNYYLEKSHRLSEACYALYSRLSPILTYALPRSIYDTHVLDSVHAIKGHLIVVFKGGYQFV